MLAFVDASPWWNYPGLEAWKFLNLLIFIGGMLFVLRRPLSEALQHRRETIRQELEKSRQDMAEAKAALDEIETRLSRLDSEVQKIQGEAAAEAEAERKRIAEHTELEIGKLRTQAQREVESAGKVAAQELRRFVAEESVKLAEQLLRRDLRPDEDARIIRANIARLGGDRI